MLIACSDELNKVICDVKLHSSHLRICRIYTYVRANDWSIPSMFK